MGVKVPKPPKAIEKQIEEPDPVDAKIEKGTSCKHNGCNVVFKDDSSRIEDCIYHPGFQTSGNMY